MNNIKIDITELYYKGVEWIYLVQDKAEMRIPKSVVQNPYILRSEERLNNLTIFSF
jgi:hypothetical protein